MSEEIAKSNDLKTNYKSILDSKDLYLSKIVIVPTTGSTSDSYMSLILAAIAVVVVILILRSRSQNSTSISLSGLSGGTL